MSKISLKVVTPERIVFEDSVDSILVNTEMGEIMVLAHHTPIDSLLRAGEMILSDNGNETSLAVSTGMIEVRENSQVIVLADTAERSEELELEVIEEAKKQAQARVEEAENSHNEEFALAAANLERELARHKVALKKRHR